EIRDKVKQMITDPARIKKDDLGHPEVCTVYTYHNFYNKKEAPEICASCKAGTIGCVACKKRLTEKLDAFMEPLRERRAHFAAKPEIITDVLANGNDKARAAARATMELVREAMGI
ncbi:MAG: tryptophan--tRNA ligase, partial [Clostridia bacterium]|nr:tryptophan--tRNA ligase [Clostridia bacterium]